MKLSKVPMAVDNLEAAEDITARLTLSDSRSQKVGLRAVEIQNKKRRC
jgi:hypothetical protein